MRKSLRFWRHGQKIPRDAFENYGEPYAKGDVVGCLLDCDEGTIAFTKNGAISAGGVPRAEKSRGSRVIPGGVFEKRRVSLAIRGDPDGKGFAPPRHRRRFRRLPGEWVRGTGARREGAVEERERARAPLRAHHARLERRRDGAHSSSCCETSRNRPSRTSRRSRASHPPARRRPVCSLAAWTPNRRRRRFAGLRRSGHRPRPACSTWSSRLGKLNLSGVRFFVLDEADRLLDAGNQGDMLRLFARMPRSGRGFKSFRCCSSPPPPHRAAPNWRGCVHADVGGPQGQRTRPRHRASRRVRRGSASRIPPRSSQPRPSITCTTRAAGMLGEVDDAMRRL